MYHKQATEKRLKIIKTLDPITTYTVKQLEDIGLGTCYISQLYSYKIFDKFNKKPLNKKDRTIQGKDIIDYVFSI